VNLVSISTMKKKDEEKANVYLPPIKSEGIETLKRKLKNEEMRDVFAYT